MPFRCRTVAALHTMIVVSLLVAACGASGTDDASFVAPTDAVVSAESTAQLYRSATCACCEEHAVYLEAEGLEVVQHVVDDPGKVKRELGIPEHLWSCHTTVVEGYVVEGHVPIEDIDGLLEHRPDVRGIALPGMPAGSPGMPGDLDGPLEVHPFGEGS